VVEEKERFRELERAATEGEFARLQQERQDWAGAEANLRWAVTKREAAHGADSNLRVIRDLWVLAAHFQRAGMPEAADRTTQDALARAARYLGADA